jgi:hypothetical protein
MMSRNIRIITCNIRCRQIGERTLLRGGHVVAGQGLAVEEGRWRRALTVIALPGELSDRSGRKVADKRSSGDSGVGAQPADPRKIAIMPDRGQGSMACAWQRTQIKHLVGSPGAVEL